MRMIIVALLIKAAYLKQPHWLHQRAAILWDMTTSLKAVILRGWGRFVFRSNDKEGHYF